MAIEEFTGQLDQERQPQVVEFTGELDKNKTSNPLHGAFGRAAEILGSGAEAFQRMSAPMAEGIQQALPESMRSKYLTPEAAKSRQQEFTKSAQDYSKSIGYEPSTSLADLGDNPLKVVPFVIERVITSSPDTVGAAVAFTPYVMSRANEILNERLKNDGKTYDQATVGDVTAATAGAIGEATLEKFATKRILPGGKGIAAAPAAGLPAALKRVGKEVGVQGGTESLEELASYGGETIGTKKGFQSGEAGERMLEAGIVGAGLGGGTRGAREAYDAYKQPKIEELPADAKVEPIEPKMTKGERKDMEQAEDRARAAAETPVVPPTPITGKEPWEEILTPPEKPPVAETPIELSKPPLEPLKPIDMNISKGKIEGVDEIDLDPAELKLSKDVPQFKEEADEQGIVEPLKGKKYEYVGTPPIQVWRRLDGSLEVISGRHRWDLAKRTGAAYIPAQVFDEAKGFNSDMAAIMDAELNIRDGKGKITDYVNYFKTTGDKYGLTKEDYESRGLLDSKEGKRAYAVTVQGVDELIQALRGRQVSEDTAYRIANAVPNDARLQTLGLKLVNEKPLEQAINILHAAKTIEPKAPEMGGDLFGFDDSGLKLAEDMGKLVMEKQKALSADIGTIERAGKNPAIAKKYGINVDDPAGVTVKVKELKARRAAWDNWASDPELVDQIRREIAGEVVEPPVVEVSKEPVIKKAKKPKRVEVSEEPVIKKTKPAETKVKPAEKAEETVEEKYRKAFDEMAKVKTRLMEARKAGEDTRELERQDEEVTRKSIEAGQKYDAWKKEQRAAKEEGDKVKSVKMRRDPMGTDYLVTLNDGRTAAIYKSDPGGDGGLGAWHIDETGYKIPGPSQLGHVTSVLGYNKKEAVAAVAQKLDAIEKYRIKKETPETLPSFELEPEEKLTSAEKKAAAEREAKEIADREREFFALTPRTPEQGAGNYLQQDMIGAMGLTEAEFKNGIDKKSTEPGEPLILRDVTGVENDTYNDDANRKVDDEIIDQYNGMDNVKEVEVKEDNVEDSLTRQAKAVEEYVDLASQGKVTAAEFMKSAREAAAKGDITPDVLNSIEYIYKNYPSVLEGIRFEVMGTSGKASGKYRTAGHYQPLARMIRLFKDTSGVMNPATVRHEIAHTMEQMMTPEQKRMVIRAWKDALIRATRAETTEEGQIFFHNISKFLHDPKFGTLKAVIKSMPNVSYYQYVNPSEYWAVNAEEILKSRAEGASSLRQNIEKLHEGLKQSFGMSNFWVGNKVFDQILSGDRFTNKMLISYLNQTKMRNYLGDKAPLATWDSMGTNWLENQKYKYVDKYIDLLRIKQDVEIMSDKISEDVDAYTKETLSHSRISTRIKDFMRDYVANLADVMRENNISQQQLHEYLLARHAPEYNKVVGSRNPTIGDNASSITTQEAENYIRALGEKRVEQLNKAAEVIDKMSQSTRDILVDSGIETEETVKAWEQMYKFYVPMYRKDLEYTGSKAGAGRGFQVQGKTSKAAMGSTKEVSDISESIIKDHVKAIERAERARVSRAMYAMAISHPNPSFWMPIDPRALKDTESAKAKLEAIGVNKDDVVKIMQTPKKGVIDPKTSLVEYVTSRTQLQSDNVLATRINGEDVYVVFNNSDPRAHRLALAMKNMDLPDVEGFYRASAYVTRWFAMVNTQLNPIFGLWNFARDVQGAALNLSTTPLKGLEKQVLKDSFANVKVIYQAIRQERKTGEKATNVGASDWYDFQESGGTTGYKAQFVKPQSEVKILESAINDMNRGKPMKAAKWITDWISDYNDTLENAVRLSAYKAGLAKGMSKQEAANIAKNLTVNFNRKGANSQIAGSLFAFFNASVQGTSRLYQTLKGPMGKKIMIGGFFLGMAQAAMMSLAGFEDDEPPEFVKEKNIIIPMALFGFDNKKYISFPMPLGFNVFPGLGRIFGETIAGVGRGDDVGKKFFDALSLLANSFNPLGSSGLSLQTIMPTPLDPLAALSQNKDAFGRPIYKADRETNPQVGYERTRESTDATWKNIAMLVNYMTGGTADVKGAWSPTGDEIAFLAGQITGGLGREFGKIYGGAKDLMNGDEIPPYKIPLFGKLYGDAESKSAVKNRFYANVTKLAEAERTVKGMQKRGENISEYRREHPETQLINMTNRIENEITQLNKRRSALIERGATIEQIKRIEDIKEKKMRTLNERYDTLRRQ